MPLSGSPHWLRPWQQLPKYANTHKQFLFKKTGKCANHKPGLKTNRPWFTCTNCWFNSPVRTAYSAHIIVLINVLLTLITLQTAAEVLSTGALGMGILVSHFPTGIQWERRWTWCSSGTEELYNALEMQANHGTTWEGTKCVLMRGFGIEFRQDNQKFIWGGVFPFLPSFSFFPSLPSLSPYLSSGGKWLLRSNEGLWGIAISSPSRGEKDICSHKTHSMGSKYTKNAFTAGAPWSP